MNGVIVRNFDDYLKKLGELSQVYEIKEGLGQSTLSIGHEQMIFIIIIELG
jgi:hypothetical protein